MLIVNTKHYFFSFLHHKTSPRDATLPKHTTFLEMTPAGIYNSDDFAPAMTLLLSVTLSPLANDSQSTELPPVSEFSLLPLSVSGANATVLYRLLRLMVQYLHQPRQLHRQARPLPALCCLSRWFFHIYGCCWALTAASVYASSSTSVSVVVSSVVVSCVG